MQVNMARDVVYTNGVIAVKEQSLLGAKLNKLCEGSADEAFRAVIESGFGKGAEAQSVFGYENLLSADERDLDLFIREYAPTAADEAYFLVPRDFHNAKAAIKANYATGDFDEMKAPSGLIPAEQILSCVKENDFSPLYDGLRQACEGAAALFSEERETKATGAEIGIIFENAKNQRLLKVCARNRFLKKLIQTKADMTNILTAMRAQTPEYALNNYVSGGKLSFDKLQLLMENEAEKAARAFDGTPYADFVKICFADKTEGKPCAQAELMRDNLETDFLGAHKYELKKSQPFLYYVLRRRAENANLRIIFVCLMAGMDEGEIKSRLRG